MTISKVVNEKPPGDGPEGAQIPLITVDYQASLDNLS